MNGNLLVIHGGAPTAVMNASLYGVVAESKRHPEISRIIAANGGTGALLTGDTIDLTDIASGQLELLKETPGSAIGTSRDCLGENDYREMERRLQEMGVSFVLMNGGNGTMDTCKKLAEQCRHSGIRVCGIPKTIDNDLSGMDHSPGFPSAARYLAGSVREVAQDVRGLAIHVTVIEAMGRDAGWLAASSVLARQQDGDAPHMILCPETPFDEQAFLDRVGQLHEQKKGVVVVASEGLRHADGKPIVPPVFQVGRATYFGDVSAHLAQTIIRKLGIKARSEKPGILGRASSAWTSEIDRQEAIACGEEAVRMAIEGKSGYMSSIVRTCTDPYASRIVPIPIDESVLKEKTLPASFIDAANFDIDGRYASWLSPLTGGNLGTFVSFRDQGKGGNRCNTST
jgi:6-phosphofructokinase 1